MGHFGVEKMEDVSDPGLRDCVYNIVQTGLGDKACLIFYLCCSLLV
jgi:hypothetical protein